MHTVKLLINAGSSRFIDGSQDDQITCFKESCPSRLDILRRRELELLQNEAAGDDEEGMNLEMSVDKIPVEEDVDNEIDSSDASDED
jgi:hypothetical protein